MAPIRIAIVGLSASAKTSWAAEGHLPYLLSERGRAKYAISALCNSSVGAAKAAVQHFHLPSGTKSYGNPQDIASDPNIDLVVVNTRVDLHHVAIPSIKAGKSVWVEWPLAEDLDRATGLAENAVEAGSPTVVGLQGRYSPVVLEAKRLLESGLVGKVVSSDVLTLRSVFPPDGLPESLEYFTNIQVGGNMVTVVLGHVMDFVHFTLGEYARFSSRASIQKPQVRLLSETSDRTVTSSVPDMVVMHGELAHSAYVAAGATLSVNFRMEPPPFPDEPAFVWTIYGERGDIRITSPDGPFLHTDSYTAPISIESFDHASG